MYNATWKAWDGHIESKECKDTSELDSFIELWTGYTGHINYDAQICCALDGCGIVTWEVVPLSYDCLACGEMVVTDDEDRHVVGLCDCCLDGDYSSPYDPPSQSDYDYTCTCVACSTVYADDIPLDSIIQWTDEDYNEEMDDYYMEIE